MKKQNEYIFTLGLNKHDPMHVKVASILNRMDRRKSQFIVNAVLCYLEQASKLNLLEIKKDNESINSVGQSMNDIKIIDEEIVSILGSLESFR